MTGADKSSEVDPLFEARLAQLGFTIRSELNISISDNYNDEARALFDAAVSWAAGDIGGDDTAAQ